MNHADVDVPWPLTSDQVSSLRKLRSDIEEIGNATGELEPGNSQVHQRSVSYHVRFERAIDVMSTGTRFVTLLQQAPGWLHDALTKLIAAAESMQPSEFFSVAQQIELELNKAEDRAGGYVLLSKMAEIAANAVPDNMAKIDGRWVRLRRWSMPDDVYLEMGSDEQEAAADWPTLYTEVPLGQ